MKKETPSLMLEALVAGVVKQQLEHHNLIQEPTDTAEEPIEATVKDVQDGEIRAAGKVIQHVTKNEVSPGAARGTSQASANAATGKTGNAGAKGNCKGKGIGKGPGNWHPNTSGLSEYATGKTQRPKTHDLNIRIGA